MKKKLRVFIVSAEVAPFTSAPGAPAACGSAAQAGPAESARCVASQLAACGAAVSIIMPRYRRPEIDALPLETVIPELWVPLGSDKARAAVQRASLDGLDVYFIENAKYFLRDRIFGTEHGDYLDNDERFAFFSRAVVEFLIKAKRTVDVIHCHDWPTALVPLFLRTHFAQKPQFRETAVVLTLQDLSAQGQFPAESLAYTGLNWDYFTPDQLALNGKFNFLKAGMIFADALAGVRPGEGDGGLAEILARREDPSVMPVPEAADFGWADVARRYLDLYERTLETKKGGPHGR